MSVFGDMRAVFRTTVGAIVAQLPDAGTAGGNARGAAAVDLQMARNAATQVASGTNSVVAGGLRNTASANVTVVAGGQDNTVSGVMSWIPGGSGAVSRVQQMGAWAFGFFSAPGDAQAGERVMRRITTDATPLRLSGNGLDPFGGFNVLLPANSAMAAKLLVVAHQTGGSAGTVGHSAMWEATVLLRRGATLDDTVFVGGWRVAGPVTVIGGAGVEPSISVAAAAAWRLTLAADTSVGGLAITGTGEANKSIRWVARIISAEVTA